MPRLATSCPICLQSNYRIISQLFRDQDFPERFTYVPNRNLVSCQTCGNIMRFPVEIFDQSEINRFGGAYYDRVAAMADWSETVNIHIDYQVHHYQRLHEVLHRIASPMSHPQWLDVGSAGCPTAYDDFQFHTVEPDARVVAVGQQRFRADRIHYGVIETFTAVPRLDGIVFHDSFYCIPDPNAALARARELLREDGLLVIRIGSHFMECHDYANDEHHHRIEDIFRGDVMWNYFNPLSLSHICARHGFALEQDLVISDVYSDSRSWRYFIFKRQAAADSSVSFESMRALQEGRLQMLLNGFDGITQTTLDMIDRPDVAMIGARDLIRDLWRGRPPKAMSRHIDLKHYPMEPAFTLDGLSYCPMPMLAEALRQGEVRHVVIASFRDVPTAIGLVVHHAPLNGARLYIPTRRSGIERLMGEFDGAWRPIKAFALMEIEIDPEAPGGYRLIDGGATVRELRAPGA
ncbi:class I SAM-dependent methyltransferase [Azospirillum sp. TSO35-2]|uniref:class I SAM-dependent methyltransferase n=1 Tax=Azospirillum sp. TSO35-2 TaxID=716796 RepID=UPI0011B75845|nr:class I SAM-dependent methyltransferase [Azospirillum sp. TSO35-2]